MYELLERCLIHQNVSHYITGVHVNRILHCSSIQLRLLILYYSIYLDYGDLLFSELNVQSMSLHIILLVFYIEIPLVSWLFYW